MNTWVGEASGTPVAVRLNVTTAERVRSALLEGIPSGLLTMEAMARKLATSKRTLQRRLEKGTSYQQVLMETREALARHHLNAKLVRFGRTQGAPLSDVWDQSTGAGITSRGSMACFVETSEVIRPVFLH